MSREARKKNKIQCRAHFSVSSITDSSFIMISRHRELRIISTESLWKWEKYCQKLWCLRNTPTRANWICHVPIDKLQVQSIFLLKRIRTFRHSPPLAVLQINPLKRWRIKGFCYRMSQSSEQTKTFSRDHTKVTFRDDLLSIVNYTRVVKKLYFLKRKNFWSIRY